ncbi:birA, biotin-(acetyl-CoA-carboxylase) ligase [Belliella baltica DSM 15883]|uniref:BirA, biotin-(Acetyl-CoA-carboxylase) ligase n=1 Tax=Belliella baltica (strain DSM 15883 / CIP 108006 / LMG 21964 / BA134) TaxID=866536 RepID=I3Z0Q0_BELBD|nr:biotin--[acetyl-CoA-carboxylase] ligase [Belliella baltica]AFL82818.1 birA, biotin-(acetyl-CoA-carboxylase) ligase [Belliella baltica DSM 15883]
MYKILANTIFLGKDIINLSECHSTNEIAMGKIKSKEAAEGTIITTENQTKGKGQRGNIWQSEAGKNLTFSLILSPKFIDPREQFNLNIFISNAIHEVLSQYTRDLKIKWPNDIVHDFDGKLGGILIENIIGQKGIEFSIIGIGLNINQFHFEIPTATSLTKLSGIEFDKWEIFKLLIKKIETNYLVLKNGNLENLRNYYMQNLFRFEKWSQYYDKTEFKGKIINVCEDGRLVIQKDDGEINYYNFKEVSFV